MSSWCSCTGIFGISSYILTKNWTHFKKQQSHSNCSFLQLLWLFCHHFSKTCLSLSPSMDAAQCTATPRCPRRTVAVKWHWMLRCFGWNLVKMKTALSRKKSWLEDYFSYWLGLRCFSSGANSHEVQWMQWIPPDISGCFPISFTNKWLRTLVIISSRVIPSRIKKDEFDLLLCLHFPYVVMHWMTCVCNYTLWSLKKRNTEHSGCAGCVFFVITINTYIHTTCSMPTRYHLASLYHTFLWDHPCLTLDLGKIYRKFHSFPKDPCMGICCLHLVDFWL